MFIRIKKIKNNHYAYLVENKWRKRRKNKVKQKTLKYLGKIYKVGKESAPRNINSEEFKNTSIKKLIIELIRNELNSHNFKEIKNNIFELDNSLVDLEKKEVINKNSKKQICLELNNNFLCSYTLRKLLNFKPKKNLTKIQIGKQLANTFESAGISISKEVFVYIAQKIIKEIK